MKKIICLLLIIPQLCFAQSWDTSNDGSAYNKTISSFTSTTLFTPSSERGLREVLYFNNTGSSVYISTFSTTNITTSIICLLTGSSMCLETSAFQYALLAAAATATSGLYVIIIK